MRRLCNTKLLPAAAAVAAATTVLCGAYLHDSLGNKTTQALPLLVAGMLIVSLIVAQMAMAWTPDDGRRMAGGKAFWIVGGAAVALAAAGLLVDPWLGKHLDSYYPEDVRAFLVTLPFRATFQPLVVIVFPYVVVYRLTENVPASVAASVAFAEVLVFLKSPAPEAAVLAVYVVVSGVYALVQALAYRRGGVVLLVICAGVFYSRFLFHLIA